MRTDEHARDYSAHVHLMRNGEIDFDIAFDQLLAVADQTRRFTPPCALCLNSMFKTCQCNSMSHCNVEKCYVCGRTTAVGKRLPAVHWNPRGSGGCPRFDCDPYWNEHAGCDFACQEDSCYGGADEHDCQIASHQKGIKAMHMIRKEWHIVNMLKSLPHALRRELYDALIERY